MTSPDCHAIASRLVGKRVFLTGGTGFFGKSLLDLVQEPNVEFVVLSRNPTGFLQGAPDLADRENVTLVQGDVRSFTFPSGSFDLVIHAATDTGPGQQGEAETRSVIMEGTRRVLEFARQAGAQRLLYVSSGAVYGVQPPHLRHMSESFPCAPVTAYGQAKLQAEKLCQDSGVESVIARCFAFLGPRQPLNAPFAIADFIRNCLEDQPLVIEGDGTTIRSYLYAADLAEWLCAVLLKGRSSRIYNVGSEEEIAIHDLARLVRDCARTDNDVVVQGKKMDGAPPARYVPSVERVMTELGVRQRYSLTDAISQTINWHRAQQRKDRHL